VTFWRNGFSFGDGPLLLYDDPQSAAILEAIHSGTVPPALLGIKAGQLVALAVAKRTQEDYVEAGGSDGRRPSTPPTGE
ncbi:SEP domain-containing protein, partial [Mycena vulgaris]